MPDGGQETFMRFVTVLACFILGGLAVVGLAHSDLFIVFHQFESMRTEARNSCVVAGALSLVYFAFRS